MDKKINNNDHKYVDLGLPSGTLWATMNVGASKPTDGGLYFQWGDTKGYTKEQVGTDDGKKNFIGLIISGIQVAMVRLLQSMQVKVNH